MTDHPAGEAIPVDQTVEELIEHVSGTHQEEHDLVRHNIMFLNAIDDRFSARAASLFVSPGTERYSNARNFMRQWLTRHPDMPQAQRESRRMNPLAGKDYNEAGIVLYDSTIAVSVTGVSYLPENPSRNIFRACKEGDFYFSRDDVPRPDLFTASTDELNRYFRSVTVAAIILGVERNIDKFCSEAPAFVTWMSTQENVDDTLATALRIGSLDIGTINAITGMQQTTPSPLHSGLI